MRLALGELFEVVCAFGLPSQDAIQYLHFAVKERRRAGISGRHFLKSLNRLQGKRPQLHSLVRNLSRISHENIMC
jgi:hypothetical protein